MEGFLGKVYSVCGNLGGEIFGVFEELLVRFGEGEFVGIGVWRRLERRGFIF